MKPTRMAIDWCFECPNCGSELWFRHEELKRGQYIECCSKKLGYVKLYGFKVKYTLKPIKQKKKLNPKLSDAIDVLTTVGFTKGDSTKLVSGVFDKQPEASVQELVKLAIAGVGE